MSAADFSQEGVCKRTAGCTMEEISKVIFY